MQRDPSVLEFLDRFMARLESAGTLLAGTMIFAVMAIVFVDVVRRYFLNSPLLWSYDLIGMYLVPALFAFALSDTFRSGQHVAVDIVYLRLGTVAQRLCRLLAAVTALAVFVPIAWLAVEGAAGRLEKGEVMMGPVVDWPTWIPTAFVALGFGVLCLRLLLDALALAVAVARRTAEVRGESAGRQDGHATIDSVTDLPVPAP